MAQCFGIEGQASQEVGGGTSAQPLQDAVGVLRVGQYDAEGLKRLGHACAVYGEKMGHAGGQGATGTAVAGVEVRRLVAGRTALGRFVGERARLAQEASLGCLADQNAVPTATICPQTPHRRAGLE